MGLLSKKFGFHINRCSVLIFFLISHLQPLNQLIFTMLIGSLCQSFLKKLFEMASEPTREILLFIHSLILKGIV